MGSRAAVYRYHRTVNELQLVQFIMMVMAPPQAMSKSTNITDPNGLSLDRILTVKQLMISQVAVYRYHRTVNEMQLEQLVMMVMAPYQAMSKSTNMTDPNGSSLDRILTVKHLMIAQVAVYRYHRTVNELQLVQCIMVVMAPTQATSKSTNMTDPNGP